MRTALEKLGMQWRRPPRRESSARLVHVGLQKGAVVEVSAKAKAVRTLFTNHLYGCNAITLFVEDESGDRAALMTHFFPGSIARTKVEIQSRVYHHPLLREAKTKRALMLVVGIAEKGRVSVGMPEHIEELRTCLREELGEGARIKVIPYVPLEHPGCIVNEHYGTLTLKIPPKLQGEAKFRTWFGDNYPGFQAL